jgi:hypothetical protein
VPLGVAIPFSVAWVPVMGAAGWVVPNGWAAATPTIATAGSPAKRPLKHLPGARFAFIQRFSLWKKSLR